MPSETAVVAAPETASESAQRGYAATPAIEQQADFLDAMGGPSAVARLVSKRLRLARPLTQQSVSNWRTRGTPWRYRMLLSAEAKKRGVAVPPGFLG